MGNLARAIKELVLSAIAQKAPPTGHEFYGNQYGGGGGGGENGGGEMKKTEAAAVTAALYRADDFPADDPLSSRDAADMAGRIARGETELTPKKEQYVLSPEKARERVSEAVSASKLMALQYPGRDSITGASLVPGTMAYVGRWGHAASGERNFVMDKIIISQDTANRLLGK